MRIRERERHKGLRETRFIHCFSYAMLRQLEHENIVKLYGVCTKQGPIFIVQELLVNGEVEEYISTFACVCDCVDPKY